MSNKPHGSQAIRERSAARLAAVQALYEMDMTDVSPDQVLEDFLKERWKAQPIKLDDLEEGDEDLSGLAIPDGGLLSELVRGVTTRRDDLDGMIGPSLSGEWTVERLETLLRAILRSGTFELLIMADVPARVVINEYVNVAKAFYEGTQPGLVNGVLDKLARVLRGPEMAG